MQNKIHKSRSINNQTRILATIYVLILIWILLLKMGVSFSYMSERHVNIIPFFEWFRYGKMDTMEFILNGIIFIPLGIYTHIFNKNLSIFLQILILFSTSFIFESIQYIFRIGAFDATDLVSNTSGGIVGLIIMYVLRSFFINDLSAQRFVNIVAGLATVGMVSFLILLKLQLLPIRYQ